MPLTKLSLIVFPLISPCRNPAANKSPAPVRSTTLRFLLAEHSTTSSPLIANAPLSPRVITINFLIFENSITSLKLEVYQRHYFLFV